MKASSIVNRSIIRGADGIVRKCRRSGGKIAGRVRRQHLLKIAALAVESEIRKDPESFARYIVSRMVWDMLADKSSCEVWMA